MEEFGKLEERVVLVGVQTGDNDNVEESLDELEELASTAGAVTVGKIIQNREAVHPGTYIGKGKIEEVRALVYAMDANGIICDDELSPAQLNNLERELDCKVMDRTLLILDIGGLVGSGVAFEKVFLLYNPMTYEKADIISTYVYRMGIGSGNYSYATAVGLFEGLINLVLLTLANIVSKKTTESGLF